MSVPPPASGIAFVDRAPDAVQTARSPAAGGAPAVPPAQAATDQAPPPTVVTQTKAGYGPTPWVWNQWLPGNDGRESPEFLFHQRMTRAAAAEQAYPAILDRATKALAAAKARLDAASGPPIAAASGASAPATAATPAQKAALQAHARALAEHAAVVTRKVEIDGELATSQRDFKAWLVQAVKTRYTRLGRAAELPAVTAEIEAYDPIQHYQRSVHVVTIAGRAIALSDHAQAYLTELAGGLGGTHPSDTPANVARAVDAANLSPDDKAIMKAISGNEGRFTTTENYDIGGVTWGFQQWTTGLDGRGSIIAVLLRIRQRAPAVYQTWFVNNGIDVEGRTLVVRRRGAPPLIGPDAVRAVRTDPILSAAFALSGTDPAVQSVQIESAKTQKVDHDGLDRSVTLALGRPPKRYSFRARDIFTSEWGAAIVVNAGVHAGPGKVDIRLHSGLAAFFASHPAADPEQPSTWAAAAEAFIASRMIGEDTGRAEGYRKAGMSKRAFTYDADIPAPLDFGLNLPRLGQLSDVVGQPSRFVRDLQVPQLAAPRLRLDPNADIPAPLDLGVDLLPPGQLSGVVGHPSQFVRELAAPQLAAPKLRLESDASRRFDLLDDLRLGQRRR